MQDENISEGFFVTTVCHLHRNYLDADIIKHKCLTSLEYCCNLYKARMFGYVIMPNHIHFILLIKNKRVLSRYMNSFKAYTSAQIRQYLIEQDPNSKQKMSFERRRQLYKVWEDGYHKKEVYTGSFCRQKLEYIHNNPISKHWKLAQDAVGYYFSSARFYEKGEYGAIRIYDYRDFFEAEQGNPFRN